jgi:hypothetical protein
MDFAQDGDLTNYTSDDIADAAEWSDNSVDFASALVTVGFIDEVDGTRHIHDWWEYAGRLIEKRVQNRERMKRTRAAKSAAQSKDDRECVTDCSSTCNERATHNRTRAGATVPNLTVPNPTITVPILSASGENAAEPLDRTSSVDYQSVVDNFNTMCRSFPTIKSLNDSRRKAIKAAMKTYNLIEIFKKAEASDFLSGRSGGNSWSCSFDWILKPANILKIHEGNYDNKSQHQYVYGGADGGDSLGESL